MSVRDALRVLAEALPAGSAVPVPRELLLQLLAGESAQPEAAVPPRDLSVAQVAAHFSRSPGTARAWVEAGMFEGAYKLRDRSWRVPVASLAAFVERQRVAGLPANPKGRGRPIGVARPTPLAAWREVKR